MEEDQKIKQVVQKEGEEEGGQSWVGRRVRGREGGRVRHTFTSSILPPSLPAALLPPSPRPRPSHSSFPPICVCVLHTPTCCRQNDEDDRDRGLRGRREGGREGGRARTLMLPSVQSHRQRKDEAQTRRKGPALSWPWGGREGRREGGKTCMKIRNEKKSLCPSFPPYPSIRAAAQRNDYSSHSPPPPPSSFSTTSAAVSSLHFPSPSPPPSLHPNIRSSSPSSTHTTLPPSRHAHPPPPSPPPPPPSPPPPPPHPRCTPRH